MSDAPAWIPDPETIAHANLTAFMARLGFATYDELWRWSVTDRAAFWGAVVDELGIVFRRSPDAVLGAADPERPRWLRGARLNIVESCLTAEPSRTAVVHHREGVIRRASYGELADLAGRFQAGFRAAGWRPGDRVAIAMPMTLEAVAAYLGVVAAGGVVVSIADSFASKEIATRLRLTEPVAVVTQDRILRGGREFPMYRKVVDGGGPRCVVVDTGGDVPLRDEDLPWEGFLVDDHLDPVPTDPDAHTNLLFSSGTTGTPKVIPWTQLTPIKAAMDGRFHQDVHPHDIVCWPTNLGWMMGPWLIYASLLNDAALALYDDAPTTAGFTRFVADAGVTILGLVPSIVAAWRAGDLLEPVVDRWSVRVMSSTGEASNPEDYRWLMERVGAPVVEYCGGTEIGGGYACGTVLHQAVPSTFTTPCLGLDVRILDDEGRPATVGELFVVPPSIGLSEELLDRDHHEVYFAGVPVADVPLRRHGDRMERLPNGYLRAHGRADDAMNLGGIKVSSAEVERAVADLPDVAEVAAIGVPPTGGGPERLVLFVVPEPGAVLDDEVLLAEAQRRIRERLNPLFKVHEVVSVDALPRTASAKVMRRELRARYGA